MSYLVSKRRRRGMVRRRQGWALGDTISTACTYDPCNSAAVADIAACISCGGQPGVAGTCNPTAAYDGCGNPINTSSDACLQAGAAATATLDQQTADLTHNWAPTGVYAPSDIKSIVANMQALIQQAQSLANQAIAQPGTNASPIQSALDMLNNDAGQAANYLSAAASAGTSAGVSAPNLRGWVLNTMTDASIAMATAASESCNAPWWASAVAALGQAASAVWSGCKAIAGMAVTAGTAVVNAAETAYTVTRAGIDVVAWITANPLLALAGAAGIWFLLSEEKRSKVKSAARATGKVAVHSAKLLAET